MKVVVLKVHSRFKRNHSKNADPGANQIGILNSQVRRTILFVGRFAAIANVFSGLQNFLVVE